MKVELGYMIMLTTPSYSLSMNYIVHTLTLQKSHGPCCVHNIIKISLSTQQLSSKSSCMNIYIKTTNFNTVFF